MSKSVAVVGAGVFGVTAAIELAERGWAVTLVDPGPIPHPLAASTDISKIVRADYGDDDLYMSLMEQAFPVWREWNQQWGVNLYHETGFLILAGGPMRAGGYEHTSFTNLAARGYPVEHLDPSTIASRFPAWTPPAGAEGYLSPVAGWAASGAVIKRLTDLAADAGVDLQAATASGLITEGSQVLGIATGDGNRVESDVTLVAAGAWTTGLIPGLAEIIATTGQPVIHFRPDQPERFQPPKFPPWAADIGTTGWYGFPATEDGIVKIANHGPGRELNPDDERRVDDQWAPAFRQFLSEWIPPLEDASIAGDRLCLYTDTTDGDFLIDRHPQLDGLAVATGGSGHGFKFAPVLGDLIADAVEGEDHPLGRRFRWRNPGTARTEPARRGGPRPGASL